MRRDLSPAVGTAGVGLWPAGRLEDTFLAAGSDAYSQTLLVYQAAKLAGKNGALEQHLDGLSRRFARKSTSATAAANIPSAH
ncbi:hypothetical protein [Methylomonas methanica]|uniref:hypothetical protein n=1 Tax=Methylomonas methanica TaxID=421 RepID=UPI0018D49FD3|nr:hypothetical protein [Methylomonas methanica]